MHRYLPPSRVGSTRLVLLLSAALLTIASPRLATAAADPKALAKCQAALAKGGAKFVLKKLGTLAKCTDGVFTCIQTVDDAAKRDACIVKARTKCAGALGGITAARQAFVAGATKPCTGLDATQITGNDGLGYTGVDCAAYGGAVTDLASLTSCLAKQHDCLASRIFQLQVPRALELLQFTPPDAVTVAPADADTLACLDTTGGTGADVNDVSLGKSVAKCQKSIEKIGAKLASQRLGSLSKCVNALFVCAETKTGDDLTKCNAKAQAGCAKTFAKTDDQSDAAKTAAGKACGDTAVFSAFRSPQGGNLDALLPNALTTGPRSARALSGICSPLVTVADYQLCLVVHLLGLSDELVTFETPRTETLLTSVGCSVDKCEGSGPPPPDVPGITQILNAAGDGTHPFDRARAFAADADGNAYVTGVDSDNVFKITLGGTITQILGASGDGQGHACDFPGSVALGPNKTVYVGCHDYVFKITAGGVITPIIGPTGDGSPTGHFRFGSAVFVAPDETVYVTGATTDNAFKITKAGVITKLIDENGDNLGNELLDPEGIAVDSQGSAYVSDIQNGGIFKITSAGAISYINTSGDPYKILIRDDVLYFSNLFSVSKRTTDGTITSVINSTGDGQHVLKTPVGIALDSLGNLYVAGGESDNVFKVTPGGVKTQIIGPDGDGKGNLLKAPQDVAVDTKGRIITGGSPSDNAFRIILP